MTKEKRNLPENMTVETVHEYRNFHRYLYLDGVEVSALAVIDFQSSLGKTAVKTAGIGNVRTPEEHQKKGYMRILMEDTVDYMAEEGYDISLLIGIPYFYHKFGYIVNMPLYKQKLDFDFIHDIPMDCESFTKSSMEPSDYPDIVELFNKNNSTRPGTLIRDTAYFGGFARSSAIGEKPVTTLFRDSEGKLVCYFVEDESDTKLTVCELECVDTDCYYRIISYLRKVGQERNVHDIDFVMANDHPFMKFIQRYGSTEEIEYPRNGMMMSRICNLTPLIEKMLPEFQERILARLGKDYSGELTVETDLGSFTIRVQSGKLTISEQPSEKKFVIPQKELVQLLSGYRELEDILITPDNSISCDNPELASIMHPRQTPFLWPTDYF